MSFLKSSGCFLRHVGFAAVLVLASTAVNADVVKVFIMGGQSNMSGMGKTTGLPANLQVPQDDVLFYYRYQGVEPGLTTLRPGSGTNFGPEITLGRTLADTFPDETFALIKMGANGTNLYTSWDPTPEHPAQGQTYVAFQQVVANGMAALTAAGHTPEIVGMIWAQGEADGLADRTTAEYEFELAEFIADIRTRYGEDLPFFLNRLSVWQTQLSPTQLANIRTAQENVTAADPFAYMIDTDDLFKGVGGYMGDTVHFNAKGQQVLGQRFAQSYIDTLGEGMMAGGETMAIPEPTSLALLAMGGLVALRRRR